MSVTRNPQPVESRLVTMPPLEMNADAIIRDFTHYFRHTLGRRVLAHDSPFVYRALVLVLRDRLIERLNRTETAYAANTRQACYLSLEYLMGRLLRNAVLNLGLEEACVEAFQRIGFSFADVVEAEHDTGLGNGGLGRLAACFLDSCASLRLPVVGYGIRYRYGMFRQLLDNGRQIEEPDNWLEDDGFPWEVGRFELTQRVHFGGRAEQHLDANGEPRYRWVDTHDVLAVPFDVPIPGYRNEHVNTLRLWRARATAAFDLEEFHAGSYADSVAAKTAAENITMVLYPNAASESGQELRLRQQYFLASASLKDCLRQWNERNGRELTGFEDKYCFQLNDTHPAIAVAELMRLLLDDYGLEWERAWAVTTATMAYTNHTLLPEALETWPVAMLERLLPRPMQIIREIHARFMSEIIRQWPNDTERHREMALIDDAPNPNVRMAYLAIIGSFSVNGVAELHSRLLRNGLFRNFCELWPKKFNSKTNGVTPRRWLAACNPALADLITDTIGEQWIMNLEQLEQLRAFADDASFQSRWRDVREQNKKRLSRFVELRTGIKLDSKMIFDVQVKRFHEYKRQALNVLHVIHLYDRIKCGDTRDLTPRAVIIGGKAAPGYYMAKKIIQFASNVAAVVNRDAETNGLLRCVFVPDYNVSAMEIICPAADISAQISTAGKEASGTGNMKFMMNGALTVGTFDGANVEIREAVGTENFFLFGLTVEEIDAMRASYDPASLVGSNPNLARIFERINSGAFDEGERGVHDDVTRAMLSAGDPWMTVADAAAYFAAQDEAALAFRNEARWTRMSVLNTAASGRFSSDRTIRAYNEDIWRLEPLAP